MMFFLLFILALLGFNPAYAGTEQTTALTSQQTATWLAQLDLELDNLKARRTSADPRVTALETEIKDLRSKIAALPAGDYSGLAEAINGLAKRIAAVEDQPTSQYDDSYVLDAIADLQTAPPVTYITAPVVAVVGTHFFGYLGGGVVLSGDVPDVSGLAVGRFVAGVRPSWDLGESTAFGLVVEGSRELKGFGVRGMPTVLAYGPKGHELGLGAGPDYSCDGYISDQGCLAEYMGGTLRGSWGVGHGLGLGVHADLTIASLRTSTEKATATRVGLTAVLRFGNPHPSRVVRPMAPPPAGTDEFLMEEFAPVD